jgi:chromosome transmission fidelity protein 1
LQQAQQQQHLRAAPGGAAEAPLLSEGGGGRAYYEALCMRAVNQSIGRAIRHVRDYAVIVLLDGRYTTPHIAGQLPVWIRERLSAHASWGPVLGGVGAFFRAKRAQLLQ